MANIRPQHYVLTTYEVENDLLVILRKKYNYNIRI